MAEKQVAQRVKVGMDFLVPPLLMVSYCHMSNWNGFTIYLLFT